jgi:hypothetical protein
MYLCMCVFGCVWVCMCVGMYVHMCVCMCVHVCVRMQLGSAGPVWRSLMHVVCFVFVHLTLQARLKSMYPFAQ